MPSAAPDARGSPRNGRYLLRLPVYYVVLVGLATLALLNLPAEVLDLIRPRDPGVIDDEITRTFGGGRVTSEPLVESPLHSALVATYSLLGALAVMIPVTWTYIFIKRRSGYDESVVHTLLILPIAVTGIVLIVKSSLALAFSLAGIVAAVRFRTTLNDTKDAVYVFLAIGVGLAAGVQHLSVALALSIVFNVVNLVLWRLNFGNIYHDRVHRTGGLTLGDAIAGPASARTAAAIGDARLMAALSPTELRDVAERMGRMKQYLHQESESKKERKAFSVLIVYTDDAEAAQEEVEPLLEAASRRWRLAEIAPGQDGVCVLEYLVLLEDGVTRGSFLESLRRETGERVQAAEMRSLKALAKKEV
jgi:hypothetical protein